MVVTMQMTDDHGRMHARRLKADRLTWAGKVRLKV